MIDFTPKYKISRDDDHIYHIAIPDGQEIIPPGVTTILDVVGSKDKTNRLMGWAKKQALLKVAEHLRSMIGKEEQIDEVFIEAVRKSAWKRDKEMLKEAGDLGTAVHNAIDAFIDKKEPILDDKTRPGYDNFHSWLKESGITLIKGDTLVYCHELMFAGALDALGMKAGKIVLLDWKTSNFLKDENALQAGAYSMALKDTYGIQADEAYVVRFGKETPGDIEPRKVNINEAIMAFRHARNLYASMNTLSLWGNK